MNIEHAQVDLVNAVSEGCFAVETPRVHVDMSHLFRVNIGVSRNLFRNHNDELVSGGLTLELRLEFTEPYQGEILFYRDLEEHTKDRGADRIVLYGFEYLWYVSDVWDFDMEVTQQVVDEPKYGGTTSLSWQEVEVVERR